MIDNMISSLYAEMSKNLQAFSGEEAQLPFSEKEILETVRNRRLSNILLYSEIEDPDEAVMMRKVYLRGFRRLPGDRERQEAQSWSLLEGGERQTNRLNLNRRWILSKEAKQKHLKILQNPYDHRCAVRKLQRKEEVK